MSVLHKAIAGGVGAVILFGISRLDDGLVGAAAFLMACFVVTVTIGVVAADGVEARIQGRGGLRRRRRRSPYSVVCSDCERPMMPLRAVWACEDCDRIPRRVVTRQLQRR